MTIEKYRGTNYKIIKGRRTGAVYIGRKSRKDLGKYGNPFPLATNADDQARLDCVEKYRAYLWGQIKSGDVKHLEALIKQKNENNGKPLELACYCAPKLCHGDVLASALDWYEKNRMGHQLSFV